MHVSCMVSNEKLVMISHIRYIQSNRIRIDVWGFNVPNLTTGEATLLETTQAHEL